MNNKGISTIIAIILMLVIAMALAGSAWLFVSGVFSSRTATAFSILDAYGDTVTIMNDGTAPLTSFRSVSVDRNPVEYIVSRGEDALALLSQDSHTIHVESKGLSATIGDYGVWIDEIKVFTPGRSYGLVVLDYDAQVTFSQTYDVYGSAANANALATQLNSLPNGTIIVISTWDEPRNNRLTNNLPEALERCGASKEIFESPNFRYRAAYLLVGVCGNGEGSGLERYAGSVDSDPNAWVETNATIGGGIQSGQIATVKIYTPLSLGTHTFRLCSLSICQVGYLTIV